MKTNCSASGILITMCLLLFSLTVRSQSKNALIKEYKNAREVLINEFIPFNTDKRIQLFKSVDQLPKILWGKIQPKFINKNKCELTNKSYIIALYDFDNDRRPDQFVLETQDEKVLQNEFGFIYDLNNDGKTDYILYNGGSMIDNNNNFYYFFYHWVDTDYDGKIDAVANNIVIHPNDSHPDPQNVLWIMDTDKDNKPDFVDLTNIRNGEKIPVTFTDGTWNYNTPFGIKTISRDKGDYFNLFNEYMKALTEL